MQPVIRPVVMILACAVLAGCVMPGAKPQPTTGAEDFASFCATCHGTGGKGDGEMAADLARKPADLTGLSARNGGDFPMTRVMGKIWGYTGGRNGETPMPQFKALLDGDLVLYDSGDGIQTPTPIRLVQLAEYLRGLQAE